jgi:hypothetical protein
MLAPASAPILSPPRTSEYGIERHFSQHLTDADVEALTARSRR